jgi:hypothetical protein
MARMDAPSQGAAETVTIGTLDGFHDWYYAHYSARWMPDRYAQDYAVFLKRLGQVTIPACFTESGKFETYRLETL